MSLRTVVCSLQGTMTHIQTYICASELFAAVRSLENYYRYLFILDVCMGNWPMSQNKKCVWCDSSITSDNHVITANSNVFCEEYNCIVEV